MIVKSTQKGNIDAYISQNSLYTIGISGSENGQKMEENIICSAVSRVLTAATDWKKVLDVAAPKDLEVIISNTTETGIQLIEDDIRAVPLKSFPGKFQREGYRTES